jgi:hypothetical protein
MNNKSTKIKNNQRNSLIGNSSQKTSRKPTKQVTEKVTKK